MTQQTHNKKKSGQVPAKPDRKPAQARPRHKRRGLMLQLQRIRRRDIILLIGLLSLACTSVIVVMLLVLQARPAEVTVAPEPTNTPGPQPTHTVTHVQITGLSQYSPAMAAAQAWAADAQLVSASANWPFVVGMDQIGQPTQWTYRFYSPDKARLLFVMVEPDGQVRTVEHVVKVTLPPRPLAIDEWLIDSPAALATWLDYGGSEILRNNPGLEVAVQLRGVSDNSGPVWLVVGSDERTETIHMVVIDARQGVVTTTSPES